MKKINHKGTLLILFFILHSSFFILHCSAQSKFGHVDYSGIITKMPGIDSIQTIVTKMSNDFQIIGEQMVREFENKQTAFEKLVNDQSSSPAVIKFKQEELTGIYKRIQEFEQSAKADIQDKQIELLEPFQTKLTNAIKKVAKENNYNYVFDIATVLFSSASDDLTNKVKAVLDIK
jgi:Skp family chaperone for outer membrane proteins